ncbi:MAG: SRPBCC family protein [Proteobacteria bacterium]|nr:SRPBCC family protein [Pseudomonadota bacterium]
MTKVSLSAKIGVSAERLWDMVGGFHSISDWHPAIEKCDIEEDGKTTLRRLTLAGGGEIVERLEQSDDERSYSYSILSSPLPIDNYQSTIRVHEDEDGNAIVDWSSEFDSAGAPESEAVAIIEGIYSAGFDNLKKMFG